jgi:two-component system, OmpR family, response regulator MprA
VIHFSIGINIILMRQQEENMVSHILVVDDDWHITELLRRAMAHAGYTVKTVSTGEEGLQAVLDHPPSLIVLDIMLPGIDGFEVARRLREGGTTTPILMLTARGEVPDRVQGLRGGGDDYLVKPFAIDELLARIEALLRRGTITPQELLGFGDLTLNMATHEVRRGQRDLTLSSTEFALLAFFMHHPRQVLTRSMMMERVWGYDFGGESNVLDVYIGYLRVKLEANNEPRLIHTIRGVGYVLRD